VTETGKGRERAFDAIILIIIDMLMLESAFLATYWFRFYSGFWLVPLGVPPLGMYLVASALILTVFFAIFYASGMYTLRGSRTLVDDLLGLFKGAVLAGLLVLALAFFLKGLAFSRSFFGLFFLSTFGFLTVGRLLGRVFLRSVLHRGRTGIRTLLVGTSPMRGRLLHLVRELPGLSIRPVGWLSTQDDTNEGLLSEPSDQTSVLDASGRRKKNSAFSDIPLLGDISDVRALVLENKIDLVVLTVSFEQLPLVKKVASELANLNVDLQFVPDLMALHTSRMRLKEIGGIPFISVREEALSGADRIVKRVFDFVASGLGIFFLMPMLAVLAALVKISSPGPIFYRQARMGRDGVEFDMIKFRTMRTDAEQKSGPVWTTESDPRVTPVGNVLRRFSLDEFPQLWNVLRGDMSLVGPRPERRVFVEEFSRQMPRYFERHRVQSGLTGWAQVHGLRGNTSIEDRTLYDLHYMENWSLGLDIRILLMTIHHVLRGENAY